VIFKHLTRISAAEWGLRLAEVMAERGTCRRRKVGCVLVNERNRIVGEGYNGAASGQVHCVDHACPGAHLPPGEGLSKCEAIHAESNALMRCADVWEARVCYVTASPCVDCTKLLLNTGVREVVFRERYAHDAEAQALWARAGRTWTHLP
jgi:dCMP deaminase